MNTGPWYCTGGLDLELKASNSTAPHVKQIQLFEPNTPHCLSSSLHATLPAGPVPAFSDPDSLQWFRIGRDGQQANLRRSETESNCIILSFLLPWSEEAKCVWRVAVYGIPC